MDREASFEPQSIPKRTRDVSGIEDKSEDASTALQAMKNPRCAEAKKECLMGRCPIIKNGTAWLKSP